MTIPGTRTARRLRAAALVLVGLLVSAPAQAQEIEEYLSYMPKAHPRAIRSTEASNLIQLFGDPDDPSYRDEAPRDGIDDARNATFAALARRFAPFLVQNTPALPINFRVYWENQLTDVPLVIDSWNIADVETELMSREVVSVPALAGNPCTDPETAAGPEDDCTLLKYLRYFYPLNPGSQFMTTGVIDDSQEAFRVAYFDMPGREEASWKAEFANLLEEFLPERFNELARLYVHPFVQGRGDAENRTYELVLQYWMYYPFNDGGNNHEGDWEHINVVVAPLSSVTRTHSADEIRAMIDLSPEQVDRADDPLVIQRVEMYFHHWVQTLDYSSPNAYLPRAEWEAEVAAREETTRSERSFWTHIRTLAYEDRAETRFNTHTVGYIGADNKGLDQLLAPPGGKNRDSHGMYPVPGTYKDIGPLGATEQIAAKWFDSRDWFEAGSPAPTEFGREHALPYHTEDVLEIIPDWERVVDLVQTDAEARARWFWLVMPIRWGYPAVESPGAGIVSDANTGNLGPEGPSYNKSWNRAGEAPSYHAYEPHKLASVYPMGWQDNFVNSWGFLNITGPTLVTLPPFDFIWRIGSAPFRYALGRPDPVYYPAEDLPTRFMTLAPAVSMNAMPDAFAGLFLNGLQLEEIVVDLLERDPEVIFAGDADAVTIADNATTLGLQFGFVLGKRFHTENLLRHSRSRVGLDISTPRLEDTINVRGELNMWEFASSIRFNFRTGDFKPYVRAGWGWSWYRVEQAKIDGEAMGNPNGPWIRRPGDGWRNLLPNTGHVGAGMEFMLRTSSAKPLAGVDIAMRVDWAWYFHRLGLEEGAGELLPEIAYLVLEGDSVDRHQLNLSLVLGF